MKSKTGFVCEIIIIQTNKKIANSLNNSNQIKGPKLKRSCPVEKLVSKREDSEVKKLLKCQVTKIRTMKL